MIYLDTHIVIWLFAGETERLSPYAIKVLNDNDFYISPIVLLELTYLHDIQRITESGQTILADLNTSIGLRICEKPFLSVIQQASLINWTRDPFDRIITAQATIGQERLLTKDQTILANYKQAFWEE